MSGYGAVVVPVESAVIAPQQPGAVLELPGPFLGILQVAAEGPIIEPHDILLETAVHRHEKSPVGQPDDIAAPDVARAGFTVTFIHEIRAVRNVDGDIQYFPRPPAVQTPAQPPFEYTILYLSAFDGHH